MTFSERAWDLALTPFLLALRVAEPLRSKERNMAIPQEPPEYAITERPMIVWCPACDDSTEHLALMWQEFEPEIECQSCRLISPYYEEEL